MIKFTLMMFISYFIGSIPTGYLIVKLLKGIDIRTVGSGSTGATNVKRVLGKKWFITVMFLDALKGFLSVTLTSIFVVKYSAIGLPQVLSAIMVIIGHSHSIFLKFTGGKSVASAVGTIFALCFPIGCIMALVWTIITYLTKYVSLSSILTLILSPFLMYLFHQPICYIIYCTISAAFIIYLHRQNIKRLIEGTESKVRE